MRTQLDQQIPHTEAAALAMPIGGIGTGNLALHADGTLRQWQLHNIPNHRGALPGSGFWLRAVRVEPPLNAIRLLRGSPVPDPAAPLVTDGHVPDWLNEASERLGTLESARFSGTYPFARVDFSDSELELRVSLRALNPMSPLDTEISSIPVAMFELEIVNDGAVALFGMIAGSLLNAVGWDGMSPIGDVTPGLGNNTNRMVRGRGWTRVVMDGSSLPEHAASQGQMLIACDDEQAIALPRCSGVDHLEAFLESRAFAHNRATLEAAPTLSDYQLHSPKSASGPSPQGKSWLGVVGVPIALKPGESRRVRFAMTWHFPNRYVNTDQYGTTPAEWGASSFWIGNHYGAKYLDAVDAFETVSRDWDHLVERTESWTKTLIDSDLDDRFIDRVAAQASLVRSPTCFRGWDGRFYGYEGALGGSTVMWSGQFGGSCPLNCTHVWQYEAALAALWPSLERNMRDTEFDVMQAPNGSIPHRLRIPTYLPQMWTGAINGPELPALDGMLATILKSLRDVHNGAGEEWLKQRWPRIARLYAHIHETWDSDADGVLSGIQPSTHDIDLAGANSFMGTLWLAALRALEEMARMVGDSAIEREVRARFELGSHNYDNRLFNGEHYVQVLDHTDPNDYQWLTGILSDQLIGQWWAHQLGLGHLLPKDHVRSALRHVVGSNLRTGFDGFEHPYRVYADAADDRGLLMCTWPEGGRPAVPTRYCDEVWSGGEYQVAAHCLFEGLEEEGLAILDALWTRHDGRRRNPYNEIECGDHYARAMAGWSLLPALTGVRVDVASGRMSLSRAGRYPWLSGAGFGTVDIRDDSVSISCASGSLTVNVERADGESSNALGSVDITAGESWLSSGRGLS